MTRGRGPASSTGTAEEGLEDVLESESVATISGSTATAANIVAVLVACGVINASLLRVRQYFIGVCDSLEPVLGIRGVVDIWVELAGKLAVGLLNFLGGCVAGDAQCIVMVAQSVALFC